MYPPRRLAYLEKYRSPEQLLGRLAKDAKWHSLVFDRVVLIRRLGKLPDTLDCQDRELLKQLRSTSSL